MESQKLKVFIDRKPLESGHAVRGIGSYTKNLLEALKNSKDIKLAQNEVATDVVHCPYFDLFFDTLKLVNKPTVVTIYDVIPLIYPKHYPPGIRGRLRFLLQKQKLKWIDAIITISETSKKDIVRFLDVPQDRIHVTHLAPARQFKKVTDIALLRRSVVKYNLPRHFILYVGDVNYNKNIEGLLRAFAILLANKNELGRMDANKLLGLVLVGKAFKDDIPETRRILQLIKELNLEDLVIMPGFVPDKDLALIYNLANVYCQPSFYEGFGLPLVEAMACGLPLAVSRTQALVEIAEDAAVFFDPKDPEDMASVLEDVLTKPSFQKELSEKGLLHVKNFSWEKTARETINVYKKVVDN